jgi:hypothetical protein
MLPFHAVGGGSNPPGDAKKIKELHMLFAVALPDYKRRFTRCLLISLIKGHLHFAKQAIHCLPDSAVCQRRRDFASIRVNRSALYAKRAAPGSGAPKGRPCSWEQD